MWEPELFIPLLVNAAHHAQFLDITLSQAGESATVPAYGYGSERVVLQAWCTMM